MKRVYPFIPLDKESLFWQRVSSLKEKAEENQNFALADFDWFQQASVPNQRMYRKALSIIAPLNVTDYGKQFFVNEWNRYLWGETNKKYNVFVRLKELYKQCQNKHKKIENVHWKKVKIYKQWRQKQLEKRQALEAIIQSKRQIREQKRWEKEVYQIKLRTKMRILKEEMAEELKNKKERFEKKRKELKLEQTRLREEMCKIKNEQKQTWVVNRQIKDEWKKYQQKRKIRIREAKSIIHGEIIKELKTPV